MSEKMQTFRKLPNTGMHKTVLSPGSLVNREPKVGSTVIRPGNTVICLEADLGVAGRKQFELISAPLPPEPEDLEQQAALVMVKRATGGFYDIVNPKNPKKPLNDKALRKAPAEALLSQMLTDGQHINDSSNSSDSSEVNSSSDSSEAPGVPDLDKLDELDWNDLTAELEHVGLELLDEYETEDHIRAALRAYAASLVSEEESS